MSDNINWPGWDVGDCIGKGGYGAVYEIRREVFGDVERCALKVITIPKDSSEIEYMRCEGMDDESITTTLHAQVGDIIREYKLMSRMRENLNIVHCDDFRYTRHEEDLGWDIYIKMELLTPLMKALNRVQTEEQIIRLGKDMCNALIACQEVNIIHRDIKPQNIFISPKGHFKLGDFGIARTMEHTTKATAGIGTYSFMAPEVALGKTYGPTVDIYSLGLVLYWLLNERRSPFVPLPPEVSTVALNEEARLRRYSGEQIPPPKHGSEELKAVVLKACAYDPKERYQTAREMLDAINGLRGEKAAAEKPKRDPEPEPEEEETVLSGRKRNKPAKAAPERSGTLDEDGEKTRYAAPPKPGQTPPREEFGKQDVREPKPWRKLWLAAAACCAVLALAAGIWLRRSAEAPAVSGTPAQILQTIPEAVPVSTAQTSETIPEATEKIWADNVMKKDEASSYSVLGAALSRRNVVSVTFLDTLEAAPDTSWDVSEAQNGSVLAWVEQSEGLYDLYIAAEGGVNGKLAASGLFSNYTGLKEVHFNGNFHTEDAADFSGMFSGCISLTNVDIHQLDTSHAENMSSLFDYCSGLKNLDVSGWDTSSVTDMSRLFIGCGNLTELDVRGWDTSSVTDMSNLFLGCSGLKNLDVSGWDTSKVTNMAGLFSGCDNLTELDISGWDTSGVTDISYMFSGCRSLKNLYISGWDTSRVTNMATLFSGCDNLTELIVSGWDTSNVTDMSNLFNGCSSMTSLDLGGWDTSGVTDISYMFSGCRSLKNLYISGWDTSRVTTMEYMFIRCGSLTDLDLSGLTTSNVTAMNHMFMECSSLKRLNLTGWDTSKVRSMYAMFNACSSLTELDVSGFDTSAVTDMAHMFHQCSSLTSLDASGFDTSNVADMRCMFFECGSLTDLDVSGFDVSSVKEKGEDARYANFMDEGRTVNGRPWEEIFQ